MSFHIRDPILHATPILDLRPTQMTLGMNEVMQKRKSWKALDAKKLNKLLNSHMAPVVIGPGEARYLIDHHHLARALHDQGVDSVFVTIVADLHRLEAPEFWNMMDFHGWTHPYDSKGRRRHYADLPKTVRDMEDDPYRSLAGELRNIGGFAKNATPFSEFVWADFLRRRIKPKEVRKDFSQALQIALDFAKSEEANYLPGWCAPHVKPNDAGAGKKGKKGRSSVKAPHAGQAGARRGKVAA
ncbi:MAG TPA: ParB-like protein [Candidatus Binataceae bacterium]|nr:ParB-like protein [Candidatus Binataceae bacterium]